jgi:phosphohistidine phosphatase
MEIYLIQHGEAKSEAVDPTRPLTDRGREEVRRVAAFAARMRLQPAEIHHSGKRRAEETALLFADALTLSEKVKAVSGLAPNDDVRLMAESLRTEVEPVMLVGHLPFLSRFASLLLVGDSDQTIIRFRMGGIVCLAQEKSTEFSGVAPQWLVAWMVIPELVP